MRQNIEKYRNPESLIFLCITGEILYFLRLLYFSSNLRMGEVTGSNPRSPTI
jgi:hypothetical protein